MGEMSGIEGNLVILVNLLIFDPGFSGT